MTETGLGLQVELNISYDEAVARATETLKTEGFGVLTEIDVKATLKKKLAVDFRRYVILGACNPSLAYRALQTDLNVGLLLPCNAIVYETEAGQAVIALVDPLAMLGAASNPALEPVAKEARARLERVAQRLAQG